ncbi:hypothetical protein DXG01_016932 [Tephrocybe rancida]|nr:hypothetical protein DXG01_016932 [Tephrocybe rancida]
MPELTPQQRVLRAKELFNDAVSLQRTGEDHYKNLKLISENAVMRVEAALFKAGLSNMEKTWEECMATLSPEDKSHFEELNHPHHDGLDALHKLDKWLSALAIGIDAVWAVTALSFWGAQKYVVGALDKAEQLEARLLRAELQALARTGSLSNPSTLRLSEELAHTEAKVAKGITAAGRFRLARRFAGRIGIAVSDYEKRKAQEETATQKDLIKRLGAARFYMGVTSKYLGVLHDLGGMYDALALDLGAIPHGSNPETVKKIITPVIKRIADKIKEESATYSESAIRNELKTRYDEPRKSLTDEDPTPAEMQEEHKKIVERAFGGSLG